MLGKFYEPYIIHRKSPASLLTRKGKRWPDSFDNAPPADDQPFSPYNQHTVKLSAKARRGHRHIPLDAHDLFNFGHKEVNSRRKDQNQLPKLKEINKHHLNYIPNDQPYDTSSEADRHELEDILYGRTASPNAGNSPIAKPTEIRTDEKQSNLVTGTNGRPCRRGFIVPSENDADNCMDQNHFSSAILMIEGNYNQTVRDFLQICTPIEQVEIDGVDDAQALFDAIYQQMLLTRSPAGIESPVSVVLLFNLENYSNWTKDRVIEVLQTMVNVLQSDYKDMTIYSKFHQDGTDSNETRLLQLRYDVKYWLSNLCSVESRHVACADFASIILESVLHMSELEIAAEDESLASSSIDDANTYELDQYI